MNIGLLSILHNKEWDFRPDMAQTYANALRQAIELRLDNDLEKQHGYFLSKKGYKDKETGRTVGANFEDKLYVGNIYRVESHLYWNDEELQDDDQIINVVVVDGPITRDGGGCSYGSKDWRDQVMYANTIPQVVGHLFLINTPGGEASARNDYDMMIKDCREKKKPTVAFVDGMCCSSGVNLASRCDRVIVMNPRDEFGCIGTMAAFWAVAHDTVDKDGFRYVELVGKDCPEKNAWWREAAKGEYEKLQADLDKDTEEFHATVREGRPLVTEDMLSGKVFEAQEVIPALVDEIGDMDRAIECVFQLADETMQAARFMTAEPEDEPGGEQPEGKEPEEMAGLSAQQRAAINRNKREMMVVDDGQVKIAGEESTPKDNSEMTDEEKKKAQEAAAAQAAEEQKPADQEEQKPAEEEQKPAEEEQKPEDEQKPADEEQKPAEEDAKPAEEEKPSEEEQKPEDEQKPAEEEKKPADEQKPEDEQKPADEQEKPAEEEKPADQPSDKTIEEAQKEIDKMQETLKGAEQMIASKDKEIADLKEQLAGMQKSLDEKAAELQKTVEEGTKVDEENVKIINSLKETVDELNKQVANLKAEVKELSGNPAPMVDAGAGIPAGNGTGEAPKGHEKKITRANMTYAHCREVARERMAGKQG
jgi:ClpP class serine protease